MENLAENLGWIFIAAGGFFVFTGAVGIIRFPDFFTRLHPAGINDSAGMMFIVAGVLLHTEPGIITVKMIILLFFSMITSAAAGHALARAALHSGLKHVGKTEPMPLKNEVEE